ncbi:transposase family protein [Streptomyces sp. NPDC056352]|uniref:transposase family protein n=1 Tax=Streptomyces sp. NPDC056352 TaxID=3345791 RepID=UPI0035E2AED3
MHDQTAVRTEGIVEQFRTRPGVRAKVDSGYQGLAKEFPRQVTAPPKKPKEDDCDGDKHAWREARRRQSSARICVEHTNAELRQWAPLRRFTGRRETFPETQQATAALIFDRAAKRPTRREYSTALVLAHNAAPAEPPGLHAPNSITGELVSTATQTFVCDGRPPSPLVRRGVGGETILKRLLHQQLDNAPPTSLAGHRDAADSSSRPSC